MVFGFFKCRTELSRYSGDVLHSMVTSGNATGKGQGRGGWYNWEVMKASPAGGGWRAWTIHSGAIQHHKNGFLCKNVKNVGRNLESDTEKVGRFMVTKVVGKVGYLDKKRLKK